MESKEIKIQVPEGYEIDQENSTFECIKFKPKKITYNDIALALCKSNKIYKATFEVELGYLGGLCTSVQQVKKLVAINQLINVAKYLNGDWEPDFKNNEQTKYFIHLYKGKILVDGYYSNNTGTPCFKSRELVKQAIEILGEETIKLALSQI